MKQIGINLRYKGGVGSVSAAFQGLNRQAAGTRICYAGIVPAGKTYAAVTQSLERREHELVPEGVRNAADADVRVFNVSPRDFVDRQGRPALPNPEETVTWNGVPYTVIAVRPDEAGATVGQRIICYRRPATGNATVEADTGRRKTYQPPDSTV